MIFICYVINHAKKNCFQEFYDTSIIYVKVPQSNSLSIINDNTLMIQQSDKPEIVYELIPIYSFLTYISNIGGIMSLWLGVAVIELHILVKNAIKYLKLLLDKLYNMYLIKLIYKYNQYHILYYVIYLNAKFIYIIHKMDKLNWKLIIKLIFLWDYCINALK